MDLSIEENVKVKAVLPFLYSLGFQQDELTLEKSFSFKAGVATFRIDTEQQCRSVSARLDILVTRNGMNLFVVEVKNEAVSISEEDVVQATSYAKLVHPPAPFALVTNGADFQLYNSLTRVRVDEGAFTIQDHYEVAVSEEARYEALKNFIGYSQANVKTFCQQQVTEHMKPLRGSTEDTSRKYVPELHACSREFVGTCREFLKSARTLLPVYGDSGTGKTCSLCDFALQLLDDGYPVLFYRAREILSRPGQSIAEDFNWTFSSEQSEVQIIKRITGLFADIPLTICIDALDEWTIDNKVDVFDAFVRHAVKFRIKLLATCTTNAWAAFLSQRGIPTHISEVSFRTGADASGYAMPTMTDEQYYQAITKYRELYGFTGRFEDRVLRDGKRSPFLLRVFFEVAQKHKMKDLTFSQSEFFNAFYDQTLEKLNDCETAAATLREVARCLLEANADHIELASLRERLGLRINEKVMPALFDYNVLDRSHSANRPLISFYFPIFRDYVVAYHVLQLHRLVLSDYCSVVDRYSRNQVFQQALKLFYPMASSEKQDVIDHELRLNAKKYLDEYCGIINDHFPRIKEGFAPHTKGKVGFIAEMSFPERVVTMHGFRRLSHNDVQEVKFVPVHRMEAGKSNLIYLHGAANRHWMSSTKGFKEDFNIRREVWNYEIEPQLGEIVKLGRLNESQNRYLLLEKLTATIAKYQPGHHKIADIRTIVDRLPIRFRDIEWSRRYDKAARVYKDQLIAAKRGTGEIQEVWRGSTVSYTYRLSDSDKKLIHERAAVAADDSLDVESTVIYRHYDKAEETMIETMRALNAFGIDSITEIIVPEGDRKGYGQVEWDDYSEDWLAATVERLYRLFLDEYKVLVESNFGQMANQFDLYSRMPVRCFVVLSTYSDHGGRKDYAADIYTTRKDSGGNEVKVIGADQLNCDCQNWTLRYGASTYHCESQRGTSLYGLIYGHGDYLEYPVDRRLIPLRSMVYGEIQSELGKIIECTKRTLGLARE